MFFVLVSAYLLSRRAELARRGRRSWDAIVEKLQPGLRPGAGSAQAATNLDEQFTNDAIEVGAQSEQGRQEMFRDAGTMMEMADYAERNGDKNVAPIAASLRSHATAIRMGVVKRILRRRE